MSNNINVLIVAPEQLLTRSGGLKTQVMRTCEEMTKQGANITFYNPWVHFDFKDFDLVHIFSMNAPNFYKSQIFIGKLPIVYSSVMWREGSRFLIKYIVNMILKAPIQLINDTVSCKLMSETASLILPNTNEEMKWLKESLNVDTKKCTVVPNGADNFFSKYSDSFLRDNSKFKLEKDFVFCSSVISQRKNLIKLALACSRIGIPLVIAGPKVDQDVYDKLISLQTTSNLELFLLGQLSPNSIEMGYLLRFNKVFCLPSFYETPGISALEAGLQGANIVITKVGGTIEYFGERALYVDPYSQKDIEKKLQQAINRNWSEYDKAELIKHIEENFSWSEVAKKTIKSYENIKY